MKNSESFFLRTLLYIEKDNKSEYDYNSSKLLAISLDTLLKNCKKNTTFSLKWTLEYKQDDKDHSIVYPTFSFNQINQNNVDILLDKLSETENSSIIILILKIINTLRKKMHGTLEH